MSEVCRFQGRNGGKCVFLDNEGQLRINIREEGLEEIFKGKNIRMFDIVPLYDNSRKVVIAVDEQDEVYRMFLANTELSEKIDNITDVISIASTYSATFCVNSIGEASMFNPFSITTFGRKINIENIKSVSCGHEFSAFVNYSGQVYFMGNNMDGQFGIGDKCTLHMKPILNSNLPPVKSIACGDTHTLALTEDGIVFSFGNNKERKLGTGDLQSRNTPYQISFDGIPLEIYCGSVHSMIVDNERNLWVFGGNKYGQLGLGNLVNQYIPIKLDSLQDIVSVSSGGNATIVKTMDDSWFFGLNTRPKINGLHQAMYLSPQKLPKEYQDYIGNSKASWQRAKSARK